ncbi:MAG: hypothetical protein V7785_10375 [Bermanella sp.]
MTKRPYISKLIPELEALVAESSDASVLRAIRSELAYRAKKKRVYDLREQIAKKLSEIKNKEGKLDVGSDYPLAKPRVKTKPRIRVVEGSELQSEPALKSQTLGDKSVTKISMTSKTIKRTPNDILNNMSESTVSSIKAEVNYPTGFLTKTFDDMRKKLLDISGGRSRLLNLNQDTRGFVRVVDELPNQLAGELLAGKAFIMDAVDDPKQEELIEHGYLERDEEDENWVAVKSMPTAREWARVKGIKIDYELPLDSGHADQC